MLVVLGFMLARVIVDLLYRDGFSLELIYMVFLLTLGFNLTRQAPATTGAFYFFDHSHGPQNAI